jgi:AcrR family transcriptional regulator
MVAVRKRALDAEDVFRTAVAEIERVGVDNVTVAEVCAVLGISRPTFYGRFGNIDGFIAETWLALGVEWLNRLSADEYSVRPGDLGLVEILTASRRRTEIFEVVLPTVTQWWATACESTNEGALMWLLSNRIGILLTQRTDGLVAAAARLDALILPLRTNEPYDSADWRLADFRLADVDFPDPILRAASEVIARSGFSGVTMSRVARATRLSTGALYPRYANAAELAEAAYSYAQVEIVRTNDQLWNKRSFSISEFGQFIGAGLDSHRETWRRLRVETFLVAHHTEALDAAARESLRKMVTEISATMSAVGIPAHLLETIGYMFHTLGVGFAILFEFGIDPARIDQGAVARDAASGIR